MGQRIALGMAGKAARPVRISAANRCRRTRIWIETQMYQRGCAPSCPVLQTGLRAPVTAEPGHRGAREGSAIIARTRDNRNRHGAGDAAPVTPAMELREIIAAHQPDEAHFGIAPAQRPQGIDGEHRAQFALDRGGPDRCAPGLPAGRGEPHREGRHAGCGFERIARRNQPPHLIQPKGLAREQADPAMAAVRGIEAPAEKPDPFQNRALKAGFARARAPATCRW